MVSMVVAHVQLARAGLVHRTLPAASASALPRLGRWSLLLSGGGPGRLGLDLRADGRDRGHEHRGAPCLVSSDIHEELLGCYSDWIALNS
jgi:hypothetical protein